MRLVRDDDTQRIELHANECNAQSHLECVTDPESWVAVKRRLSTDDRASITAAAISFRMNVSNGGQPSGGEVEFGAREYKAMSLAGLVVGIKAWSHDEALTPKNIGKLAAEDAELIGERTALLWDPPRSEEERKNSLAPSASPSEPKDSTPTDSAG